MHEFLTCSHSALSNCKVSTIEYYKCIGPIDWRTDGPPKRQTRIEKPLHGRPLQGLAIKNRNEICSKLFHLAMSWVFDMIRSYIGHLDKFIEYNCYLSCISLPQKDLLLRCPWAAFSKRTGLDWNWTGEQEKLSPPDISL